MSEQAQTIGLGIAEIIGDKRAAILQLAEEHGAYNVRVFGSVARGEARPDSDVDLLISVREGVSIFRLVGLWLALKELLGREVDLAIDRALKDYVRPNVLREAITL